MNDNNQFNQPQPMPNNNQFNQPQPMPNNNQFNQPQPIPNNNNSSDNMDYSFVEPKKKSKAWIVILLVVVLLLGGCAYYYFVLTSPKTIFTKLVNNDNLKLTENNIKNKAAKTSINLKLNSKDETYKEMVDLLENINLEFSYDVNNKEELIYDINATYKDKTAIDIKAISKKDISYLSLGDIYDKVLSVSTKEETNEAADELSKEVYTSILNAVKDSLNDATYEKTITKYNSKYVTKATLKIDDKLIKSILDKLIKDDKFITNIASISSLSKEEITDELNKVMSSTSDIDANVNLYLSLLGNKILSVEVGNPFNNITVEKDNNQYKYKIIAESEELISGYLEIKENNNIKTYTLSMYESIMQTNIVATISIEPITKLDSFDTTKAIDIEEISEEDYDKIAENILKKEGISLLVEDLGLNEEVEA